MKRHFRRTIMQTGFLVLVAGSIMTTGCALPTQALQATQTLSQGVNAASQLAGAVNNVQNIVGNNNLNPAVKPVVTNNPQDVQTARPPAAITTAEPTVTSLCRWGGDSNHSSTMANSAYCQAHANMANAMDPVANTGNCKYAGDSNHSSTMGNSTYCTRHWQMANSMDPVSSTTTCRYSGDNNHSAGMGNSTYCQRHYQMLNSLTL